MRWFRTAMVASLAAIVLAAPTAAAERTRCAAGTADAATGCWIWVPRPEGWERIHQNIRSCEQCVALGQQGVDDGRWPGFHCESFPQGLDFVYHLYVPPRG